MKRSIRVTSSSLLACALAVAGPALSASAAPIGGLDGPRGVDASRGHLVVGQSDGSVSRVLVHGRHQGHISMMFKVPRQQMAPAVAAGRHGVVWALTAGADSPARGAGSLYRYTPGSGRHLVLNVQRWQRHHPDPYDAEGHPKESNPYGVAALPDGSALVADAANNSLVRVKPNGKARIVARVKPRVIPMPAGMEGDGMPPAGTPIPSEAVVTSVTVGADGAYYIGELRGFPGTPGTSQIWRIRAGTTGAVCDPEHPRKGPCKRYADGLTSVVDLDGGPGGSIFALELSKTGWMSMEGGAPGSEVGAVIRISHDKRIRRELKPGRFITPGGLSVGPRGHVYVTTPMFGPGTIRRAR